MALQIRRGTNAERLLIVPLQGELIFTTDTKKLYVGDGATQGGTAVDLAGSGAAAISDLSDVALTSLSTGQVLKWNGSAWANGADNTGTSINSINDITDVVITTPTSGQVLKYNGTSWVNGTDLNDGTGSLAVEDLTNVAITAPTSGQVLKYNGTSWINDTDATGGSSLASLDDIPGVVLTSPTNGQVLKFDGTNWSNGTVLASLDDIPGVVLTTPTNGQVLKFDGTNWSNANTNVSVQSDAAPILGGNLDLNGFNIFNSSDGIVKVQSTLRVANFIESTGNITLTSSAAGGLVVIGSPSRGEDGNLYIVRNSYGGALPNQGVTFAQHHETPDAVDLKFLRTRGSSSAQTLVQISDELGEISFFGHDGTGQSFGANVAAVVDGAPTLGHIPTKIAFRASNGTVVATKAELSSQGIWKVDQIQGYTGTLSVTGDVTTPNFLKLAVYANDTARSAAIPTPAAGMLVFMTAGTAPAATNQLQFYNGTTWVTL